MDRDYNTIHNLSDISDYYKQLTKRIILFHKVNTYIKSSIHERYTTKYLPFISDEATKMFTICSTLFPIDQISLENIIDFLFRHKF